LGGVQGGWAGLGIWEGLTYIPLRMRKSDRPNINSGQPWSEMDMADLFDFHESGMPIEKIADYLCREIDEVQTKIDEVERQIAASVRL
jgi:hypothetical protein